MEKQKIPIWIYIFQGILCLILAQQIFSYYQFNYWGEIAVSDSEKREVLELAGRTLAMFVIGIVAIVSRNAHYFVVVFIVNIIREGSEAFVDSFFESGISMYSNFFGHLAIVALEVWALVKAYQVSKAQANQ